MKVTSYIYKRLIKHSKSQWMCQI